MKLGYEDNTGVGADYLDLKRSVYVLFLHFSRSGRDIHCAPSLQMFDRATATFVDAARG